jgi:RNA polymerase sigma factor (sigma-70 family)
LNSEKLQLVIAEAKKGKRQAQNVLMDLYWSTVYGYVFSKIQNENESEDIAIETFTKVFTKLKLYNEDFDFKTWIVSIAHNTMIDHIRKSTVLNISLDDEHNFIDIEEDLPTPEESLILKQDNDAVTNVIAQLKPEYKRIIELRYLEDKTYKEIAEELNLSLANVKVRLLRAKQLLQEILKG